MDIDTCALEDTKEIHQAQSTDVGFSNTFVMLSPSIAYGTAARLSTTVGVLAACWRSGEIGATPGGLADPE